MKRITLDSIATILKKAIKDFYKVSLTILAHIVLVYLGVYIGMNTCQAKTIYYGSETEAISILSGGGTIFRFNEPVKTISRASDFSIETADKDNPDYAVLSITPRTSRSKGQVTFLLANGAVLKMALSTVTNDVPEKVESFYDFLPKSSLVEKETNLTSDLSDLELMKSMVRREEVLGVNQRAIERRVSSGVSDLEVKLVRVYTGPRFNGYVFKLTNKSKTKTYAIDLRYLTLGRPNQALLSQTDKPTLPPQEETFFRVVAKPSSVYYNVNVPFGEVKTE